MHLRSGVIEQPSSDSIADAYYAEYHGHTAEHLYELRYHLAENGYEKFVYLAGDSSLDNKYWIDDYGKCSKYKDIIPKCKKDVCFWLNKELKNHKKTVAINCAVEESTIAERQEELYYDQDIHIRDNITYNDILIISVGGNDIALKPSFAIMAHLALLMVTPVCVLKMHPSFTFFVNYVKNGIQNYIDKLCVHAKPSKIIVSGIYFPCLQGSGWSDTLLGLTGYNIYPYKAQTLIKEIYSEAVGSIEGVEYVPLYEVLDCNCEDDYVARVEPSTNGGKKMAKAYYQKM